jgi:hypothetical protein
MDMLAMSIASIVAILLLAVGVANLLWSLGVMWPIRDPELLARSVSGAVPARMPSRYVSLGVAILALVGCVVALSVADPASGGAWLTALALVAGFAGLARGVLGYTAWWQARTPGEPFRTLDRRNYSPLCLALGVGFLILVVMRLT